VLLGLIDDPGKPPASELNGRPACRLGSDARNILVEIIAARVFFANPVRVRVDDVLDRLVVETEPDQLSYDPKYRLAAVSKLPGVL
jgi:hypothetical protein